MMIIGPHLSIARGYAKAAEAAVKMGATGFQFFSRNPRGSGFRTENEADIRRFQQLREERGFRILQAHAPYTMNLASASEEVRAFAQTVLREDVARMDELGIEYFCFHPGSHLGSGAERGVERVVEGLNRGFTGGERIVTLLETMPGKGTEVGFRFSQLREILDGASHGDRMGVCMDLCHVFSAGYDIRRNLEGVLAEFDRVVGLERLKSIHLNDSMTPFASRKDRHCAIGRGSIGLEAVTALMLHPAIRALPFYIETPLNEEEHGREIRMLRRAVEFAEN